MLDYDGTLAPFVADRMDAKPWPGVSERLEALMYDRQTRLAIVTGRSVDDIQALLETRPLPEIWGSHGWEHRQESGEYYPPVLAQSARNAIDELWTLLCDKAGEERVELKPASVAVHWRGLEPSLQDAQRVRLLGCTASFACELELREFDGGLEWRVPGCDKGTAVLKLLQQHEPCAAAFLGDDRTDEDAFKALDGRGLRVQVREDNVPTLADIRIRPPEELLDFLDQWLGREK